MNITQNEKAARFRALHDGEGATASRYTSPQNSQPIEHCSASTPTQLPIYDFYDDDTLAFCAALGIDICTDLELAGRIAQLRI